MNGQTSNVNRMLSITKIHTNEEVVSNDDEVVCNQRCTNDNSEKLETKGTLLDTELQVNDLI